MESVALERDVSTTASRTGTCAPVYLNNGASSWPKAPGVAEAVAAALEAVPEHPGRAGRASPDVLTACRLHLSRLLAVPEQSSIVLTAGATHSLNLALLGLDLAPGARVVTSVTEHNSVLRPLNHMALERDLKITIIGLDSRGELDLDVYHQALKGGPALVVLNHASSVTGRINDVGTMFAAAKRAGAATLLDTAQSLGHIDVHPLELSADVVACTGHKALLGPPGTGALYVSPTVELKRFLVGGTGIRSDLELHPPEMPTRLEAGTPNVPALAGLEAALRWQHEHGAEWRADGERATKNLRDALREIPNVKLLDDDEGARRTSVVSFLIDGWDVEEAGFVLQESFGVICRTGLHCAPLIHAALGCAPHGTIRFGVSGFTTESDIESAVQAVAEMARCGS